MTEQIKSDLESISAHFKDTKKARFLKRVFRIASYIENLEYELQETMRYLKQHEKAFDKACGLLEEYGSLTDVYAEDKLTKEQWKERLLSDVE